MRNAVGMVSRFPFYLWLLGFYPILHLYAENLGLVFDGEVVTVLILMLAATSIAFPAANLLLKDRHKTAFILGLCSVFFSLSGHVYELAFATIPLDSWTEIVFIALGATFYLLHKRGSAASYERITAPANLLALALLIWPVAAIGSDLLTRSEIDLGVSSISSSNSLENTVAKIKDSPARPDIYYIIPDGYPSDGWLSEAMAYDNSDFTRALESRGFVVVDHAQSNYGLTLVSMASILNMRFYGNNKSPFTDLDFLRLAIADNEVARQLQKRGYTFVQYLSGYNIPSPLADINRDFTPEGPIDVNVVADLSGAVMKNHRGAKRKSADIGHFFKQSFLALYLDTTILRIRASEIEAIFSQDKYKAYGKFAPERFLDTVNEIESIAAMPEATFTIVHLMKPHGPTSFDENGNTIDGSFDPSHEEYFADFRFTNSKFLQMIDTIIRESENQPVIVFQADHGSKYGRTHTDGGRLTHFNVYAAYYLPKSYSISIPTPYTLINTFPLIFNEIFETDYPMQSNQLFDVPRGYKTPFTQFEVTEGFLHG